MLIGYILERLRRRNYRSPSESTTMTSSRSAVEERLELPWSIGVGVRTSVTSGVLAAEPIVVFDIVLDCLLCRASMINFAKSSL